MSLKEYIIELFLLVFIFRFIYLEKKDEISREIIGILGLLYLFLWFSTPFILESLTKDSFSLFFFVRIFTLVLFCFWTDIFFFFRKTFIEARFHSFARVLLLTTYVLCVATLYYWVLYYIFDIEKLPKMQTFVCIFHP